MITHYDELNRLKTVKIDWLNQTATYNYDDAGRLVSLTNFNNTVTTYGYDNANRLTSLENKKSDATTLASYNFILDGNGNRTQTIQNEPLMFTLSPNTVSYTYNNPQRNRLMTAGTFSFTYDNEGQLQTGYNSTYTFDYEHRLKTIGSSYQFYYDGSGNRVQVVRSGVTTRYIYDARGNLLAEADGNNNITKYYIYGAGLIAMVTPANQTYCYHFNAVGSTIAVSDSSQNIVNKYSYDPFGNVVNQVENPNVQQPFKFVGQFGVMTEPNGFYYMRARYYDPSVGRFVSEDPLGFDGGDVNLYAYVGNNPVRFIDPMGLAWTDWQVVTATIEGTTAIGLKPVTPYGYNTDTDLFVALPNENYKGGWIGIEAGTEANGQSIVVPVGDVGPWNGGHTISGKSLNDPYWENNTRPQAETGIDLRGRETNSAGIDISKALANQLGLKGTSNVRWRGIDSCK